MSFQSILGNFALILFVLTIVTGVIWFLDIFLFGKKRRTIADKALAEFDARSAKLTADGIRLELGGRAESRHRTFDAESVHASWQRQPDHDNDYWIGEQ